LAEYQKPSYDHHRFVMSPDGSRMALSGRQVEKEAAVGDAPARIKRDASGKPMVLANVLEVVDVASGRSVVTFKPPVLFDNLALSPDNQFLAAETSQQAGVVNVLHLASRKSKQLKTGLRRIPPGGIVFSSDSRSINVLLPDRLLTIAIGSGQTKEFKFETASPAVSYSPATNMVAVGVSRSKRGRPEIQLYDVAQGKPIEELALPSGPNCVEFSIDGRFLAATIAGGVVRLWQTSDWTSVGSVAGQFAFDPGQLAVSPNGQLVAVRPRGTGRQEMKVINVTGGDTVSSIRTREMFFLPSGLLAVADVTGPFYLNTNSGSVTELPGGDAALAQSGDSQVPLGDAAMQSGYGTSPPAQTGYGQSPAGQQNPQVGYGQAGSGQGTTLPPEYASRYGQSAQQLPSSQPGYGQATPQPQSDQTGSGQATTLPPEYASRYSQSPPQQSDQTGDGQVSPQPGSGQAGYGQFTPQASDDQSGNGQATPQPSDNAGYGQFSSQSSNDQSDPQQPASNAGYGQFSQSSNEPAGNAGYGQFTPQTSASPAARDQAGYGQVATQSSDNPVTQNFQQKTTGVHWLGVSRDATRLATAHVEPAGESSKSMLTVWDLTTGQQLRQLQANGNCVSLAFSPDRNYLAASIFEQNPEADARVWHLPSGKEKSFPRSAPSATENVEPPVGQITFSADAKSAVNLYFSYVKFNRVVAGQDETIKLPSRHAKLAYWPERNELAAAILAARPGQLFSNLYVYALPAVKPQRRFDLSAVTSLAYSPDGKHLVVGQEGGQIIVYDTTRWTESAKINGGQQQGYAGIAVSNGGKYVAATLREPGNRTLLVWRTETQEQLPPLRARDHEFLSNGLLVTTLGSEGSVTFYDLDNNRNVWPWEAGEGTQASAVTAQGAAIDAAAQLGTPTATAGYGVVPSPASDTPPLPASTQSYGR
jgi:WD40 repeat protein